MDVGEKCRLDLGWILTDHDHVECGAFGGTEGPPKPPVDHRVPALFVTTNHKSLRADQYIYIQLVKHYVGVTLRR